MYGAGLLLALVVAALAPTMTFAAPRPPGAEFQPVPFSALDGWAEDAHAQAFAAFRRSCDAILRGGVTGGALKADVEADLRAACARAAGLGTEPGDEAARRFFESAFTAYRVVPSTGRRGFVTAYFEPEIEGALAPSDRFHVPLHAPPADLVTFRNGEPRPPGAPEGLEAAQRTSAGLVPYPTRGEIESGLLDGRGLEIVWLASAVEAFIVHVQGSARVRLAEGGVLRLSFAAKNGHPYTSIGRLLIERGEIPREEMSLERLTAWLEAHPQEATRVMRSNRSYVFFRVNQDLDPALGPVGAQEVQLTPGRSAAIDKAIHVYGLPVWVDARLPERAGGPEVPFRRLMIAQDTGSAIVGPARLDLFFGMGAEAGRHAGEIKHDAEVFMLLPRPGLGAER